MISMQAVQYIVRSYRDEDSYLRTDPYIGVMNVTVDGDRAYAFAMHGKLSKEDYLEFLSHMRLLGVKELHMNRHKTRQVIKL